MSGAERETLPDDVLLEILKQSLKNTLPDFFNGRRPGFVLAVSFDQGTIVNVAHITNACPACARRLLELALRDLPADVAHSHGPKS
jgi:hypothetical protein